MLDADKSTRPPLRIGIMVDSLTQPQWVAKIVREIQNSTFARVVLVVQNATLPTPPDNSFRARLKDFWARGLFNRYKAWDKIRHQQSLDAFENTDISALVKDAHILPVVPIRKRFVDRFSPQDIEQVNSADLDVLFRFGFRIIRGDILSSAKYGVWSYHHGDNREYRGSAPGFWEMYEENPVIGSILQVLTESLDAGRVIYRSFSATDPGSLHVTVNGMYWKTAEFAIRRLLDLHRYGWSYVQSLEDYNELDDYKKQIYHAPGTPIMVRFLARQFGNKFVDRVRSLFFDERRSWFMACRPRNGIRTIFADCEDFRTIDQPPDRFYADPFLIKRADKTYLFFENFDYVKDRANISFAELRQDGRLDRPGVALEKDYHLSYPFVFEFRERIYMIPETKERKTIELYRAVEFPQKWVLERILMQDILAVDSTILQRDGRLWLFANISVPGSSPHDELYLFHAVSPLEGEWTPHPQNPIVSDVRRSRPAGALFVENGKLIRPSQDCSIRYGSAIHFNEVKILSETEYKEVPCGRIGPEWYPGSICTHTYTRTEEFEILDGMVMRRRLRLLGGFSRGK